MDFRKLSIVVLLASQLVSCQVNLTRNFDPDCIIEGTVVTLTCTVEEDRNDGSVATIISGSPVIFDCPSVNTVEDNRLYLEHSANTSTIAVCGDFVSGRLMEVRNGSYIAQISITTTIAMNGGNVECCVLGIQDCRQIQLDNIKGIITHMHACNHIHACMQY